MISGNDAADLSVHTVKLWSANPNPYSLVRLISAKHFVMPFCLQCCFPLSSFSHLLNLSTNRHVLILIFMYLLTNRYIETLCFFFCNWCKIENYLQKCPPPRCQIPPGENNSLHIFKQMQVCKLCWNVFCCAALCIGMHFAYPLLASSVNKQPCGTHPKFALFSFEINIQLVDVSKSGKQLASRQPNHQALVWERPSLILDSWKRQ